MPGELDPNTFGEDQPCFGCSPTHPIGFHLRFTTEAGAVVTRFTPSPQYQGPPGVMHGGLVTTLGDEIAAWTIVGLKKRFAFTAAIEAKLLRPVRIGAEVIGRGTIASDSRRVVKVDVSLVQEAQEVFQGRFTLVLLDEAAAEKVIGGPLPEHLKKFARES